MRIFLPLFPNCPGVIRFGFRNASALNQCASVRSPPDKLGLPVTEARDELAPILAMSTGALTETGPPLWNDVTPESSQPPRALFTSLLGLFPKNGSV